MCCDNTLHIKAVNHACCAGNYIERASPSGVCCGGSFYTLQSQFSCCGGVYQAVAPGSICCTDGDTAIVGAGKTVKAVLIHFYNPRYFPTIHFMRLHHLHLTRGTLICWTSFYKL